MYVDTVGNLNTTSFNSYNVDTFNTVLIPSNETIRDLLISRGFNSKNIYFNESLQ